MTSGISATMMKSIYSIYLYSYQWIWTHAISEDRVIHLATWGSRPLTIKSTSAYLIPKNFYLIISGGFIQSDLTLCLIYNRSAAFIYLKTDHITDRESSFYIPDYCYTVVSAASVHLTFSRHIVNSVSKYLIAHQTTRNSIFLSRPLSDGSVASGYLNYTDHTNREGTQRPITSPKIVLLTRECGFFCTCTLITLWEDSVSLPHSPGCLATTGPFVTAGFCRPGGGFPDGEGVIGPVILGAPSGCIATGMLLFIISVTVMRRDSFRKYPYMDKHLTQTRNGLRAYI